MNEDRSRAHGMVAMEDVNLDFNSMIVQSDEDQGDVIENDVPGV